MTSDEWISVKDRLPENGEVLAIDRRRNYLIGDVHLDKSFVYICESGDTMIRDVIAWQPLPGPPKTEVK